MNTPPGVHAEGEPAFSDDQRLQLQALCRDRLAQLASPFGVSSPKSRWRGEPTPSDPQHGRWEGGAGQHYLLLPSLLDQLRRASGGRKGAAGSKGTWESRPAAALEAIDAERQITAEVRGFVERTLHTAPEETVADMNEIERRVPTLTDEALHELVGLVTQWWTAARVLSGLEQPPLTPHVRCPICDEQDSIRARADGDGTAIEIARCRACRSTWDESTIGLLTRSIEEAPARPRKAAAPRYQWVFVGNKTQARRWAIAQGIDPSQVYPATEGVDALAGLRGPVRLVHPPDRSQRFLSELSVMAQVVDLVRDVNAGVEYQK